MFANIFRKRTAYHRITQCVQADRKVRFSASAIIRRYRARQISAIGKRLERLCNGGETSWLSVIQPTQKSVESTCGRYKLGTWVRQRRVADRRCGQPARRRLLSVIPPLKKSAGHLTETQSGGLSATNYPQSTTVTNGRVMEIHVNSSRARAFGSHERKPERYP